MSNAASLSDSGFTTSAPEKPSTRWFVCALLFAATTINYMDRSVLSLIEPLLHNLPFMGWDFSQDAVHQDVFNNNYGNIIICFQVAYGVGLLTAGRVIDKLGTKLGYAIAIAVWALASMSHAI
ncbi:MAG: major facilitator superfamily 1, partial [Edaphobacter sp.]|nr:major facilitator superfamily 1 [Edaphobacter sp.]